MRLLPHARPSRGARGAILFEVMLALPIILVAANMFVSTLVAVSRQRVTNRESALASIAVQEVIERMRNEEFDTLVARYNADPFDDPGVPGSAQGPTFGVPALAATEGGPIEVGEIVLPLVNTGTEVAPQWELREDVVDAELQMPRDLNGDNVADGADHTGDYTLLPVLVRVRWQGHFGERELAVHTLISRFKP